jgi:hypothetical protein
MPPDAWVWVFKGPGGPFPGGVFSTLAAAEAWIARHSLTGILTAYPLDRGVHEWAVEQGLFRPDKPLDARAIGSFSSASQEHYHYEDGSRVS